MNRRVAPPSGWSAPTTATLAGDHLALGPLAESIADRYFEEFPDDLERYGEAARAWELHDTSHCLRWAVLDVEGIVSLPEQIDWLADVLRSRGFPLEHLARNLELAADVVDDRLDEAGAPVARRLRSAAVRVRES